MNTDLYDNISTILTKEWHRRIFEIDGYQRRTESFDTTAVDDAVNKLWYESGDVPEYCESPEDQLLDVSDREYMLKCMEQLSFRQRKILYLLYLDENPMTREEVASMYDVTNIRIGQIKDKAIRDLKKIIRREQFIHDY